MVLVKKDFISASSVKVHYGCYGRWLIGLTEIVLYACSPQDNIEPCSVVLGLQIRAGAGAFVDGDARVSIGFDAAGDPRWRVAGDDSLRACGSRGLLGVLHGGVEALGFAPQIVYVIVRCALLHGVVVMRLAWLILLRRK